jgi:hypothetical protein
LLFFVWIWINILVLSYLVLLNSWLF